MTTGLYAEKLPARDVEQCPAKALRDLLNEYAVADRNWSPSLDGLTFDIADDIHAHLRNELGLSDRQIADLKAAL